MTIAVCGRSEQPPAMIDMAAPWLTQRLCRVVRIVAVAGLGGSGSCRGEQEQVQVQERSECAIAARPPHGFASINNNKYAYQNNNKYAHQIRTLHVLQPSRPLL